MLKTALKVVLPLVVIAAGIGVMMTLVKTKPEAARAPQPQLGALVEVEAVRRGDHAVTVHAQGTVMPAEQVILQPQVGGRVTWIHAELVPGGRFRRGETLVRVDARDYQLALEAQRAQVDRARLDLQLERSRQDVAAREWELFERTSPSAQSPRSPPSADAPDAGEGSLALREPQVRTARVAVSAAESGLQRAQLDLSRTTLTAPFDGFVKQEQVDRGQLVTPQSQLATLVASDRFWVQVSIPIEALASIRVPGVGASREGSSARVWQDVGSERIDRSGRVVRLMGDLDPAGAMARVLVEIDDPLGLRSEDAGLPLLLGAYVDVEIEARPLSGVVELARAALRDDDKVWVVGEGNRLEIRSVRVVWRGPDSVYVREGLEPGERIVTSRIPSPIDGMRLRVAGEPTGRGSPSDSAGPEARNTVGARRR